MEKKKKANLTPEQEEKQAIEMENKILAVLMPAVGGVAFILGLVGFILTITVKVPIAIFLLIVAILGLGGIAYGVYHLILKNRKKYHKEETVPSETPNE